MAGFTQLFSLILEKPFHVETPFLWNVKVVRAPPPETSIPCFALVSPRGYRLEGLPVKLAVAMLQELG